jgi:hypothetical protein
LEPFDGSSRDSNGLQWLKMHQAHDGPCTGGGFPVQACF